jgi:hypothetical protein
VTFYRYALQGTLPIGESWVVTGGVEDEGLSSEGDIATAIDGAITAAWPTIATYLTVATKLDRVSVYKLPGATGKAVGVAEATLGLAGTNNGDPIPPQCSAVVTLLTGRPGRSYRGRQYWPAFTETTLDPTGRMTAAAQVALKNFMVAWMGAVNTALAFRSLVVISPTLGEGFPITEVKVGNVFDTQRSRRDDTTEVYVSGAVSGL